MLYHVAVLTLGVHGPCRKRCELFRPNPCPLVTNFPGFTYVHSSPLLLPLLLPSFPINSFPSSSPPLHKLFIILYTQKRRRRRRAERETHKDRESRNYSSNQRLFSRFHGKQWETLLLIRCLRAIRLNVTYDNQQPSQFKVRVHVRCSSIFCVEVCTVTLGCGYLFRWPFSPVYNSIFSDNALPRNFECSLFSSSSSDLNRSSLNPPQKVYIYTTRRSPKVEKRMKGGGVEEVD